MEFATPAILRRDWPPRRSDSAINVSQRLSSEIRRKLHMAAQSHLQKEAEQLCEEVFVDLTGSLEAKAREVLQTERQCFFFEILADYYAQNEMEAERVLEVCRVMWGQSYVAAIFALLLHKWLLGSEEAGGMLHRHKYFNVLLTGCRQLFWTDIHSNTFRFRSLFSFIHHSYTVNSRHPIKNSFLPLISQFLPYYLTKESLLVAMLGLPFDEQRDRGHSPWMSSMNVGFTPDELFVKITEMLKQLGGAEPGLVRYLVALKELQKGPLLTQLKTKTHLLLQAQLYSLTSQGGPRYPSPGVRQAAFATLDALYPAGARTRKLISKLFEIFHPLDWPRTTASMVLRSWNRFVGVVFFFFSCIAFWFRFLRKPLFG